MKDENNSKLSKRLWTNGADNGIWFGINYLMANMFSGKFWTSFSLFKTNCPRRKKP